MVSSLLLLAIGGIVLIYLAYKFIKKIVWLVFSIILILILMFASVFGIIYYDVKQISEQTDVSLNVVYVESDEAQFGTSILMKNGEVDENSLSSIKKSDLDSFETEEIDPESGTYVIYVNDEVFSELTKDEVFSFEEMINDPAYKDYDLSLTGDEIEEVISSKSSTDDLIKILFDKNDLGAIERQFGEPLFKEQIDSSLSETGISLDEALFLLVLQNSATDKDKILTLVEAYKDESITIEPERLTFSLLKWLPSGFILGFFEEEERS